MKIYNVVQLSKNYDLKIVRTGLTKAQAIKVAKKLNSEQTDHSQNLYRVEEELN
jgi:hypothetical protein